jgi:hypothetical protein
MDAKIPTQIEALKQFVANSDPASRLGIVNEQSAFLPSELTPADAPADATYKVVYKNATGHEVAFLLSANTLNPDLVAINVAKAKHARQLLPPLLADAIQVPVADGTFNRISWALFTIMAPLSEHPWRWRLQKLQLARPLTRWLTDVTHASKQAVSNDDMEAIVVKPLTAIADNTAFSKPFRQRAARAIAEIESGRWAPQTTLAHNDLWKGNIMLPLNRWSRTTSSKFYIIDWAGSSIRGFAFFDLMKLARSFKFPDLFTRRIIDAQCAALDCAVQNSMDYLLAALGALGRNLGHFPAHIYTQMSVELIQDLSRVIGDRK